VARTPALALAVVAVALAGCTSRLERSRALGAAVARASAESERPPRPVRPAIARSGAVRLSLPGAHLRDAPPAPLVVYVEVPQPAPDYGAAASTDYGPTGSVGDSGTCAPCAPSGPYLAPGGAIAPGARDPHGAPAHSIPSAAPYANAFPGPAATSPTTVPASPSGAARSAAATEGGRRD
jgi:hypothetical protein